MATEDGYWAAVRVGGHAVKSLVGTARWFAVRRAAPPWS